MAIFKVGDKARVKYVRYVRPGHKSWRPGAIVRVVKVRRGLTSRFRPYQCIVEHADGEAYVRFDQLEPITTARSELGSWQEIEDSCGWRPANNKEHAQ